MSGTDSQSVTGCHRERDRKVMSALEKGRDARGLDAKAK